MSRKERNLRAVAEIARICRKATEEGWAIEEHRGNGVQMIFVNKRTGTRVAGNGYAGRKAALASACAEMQRGGF